MTSGTLLPHPLALFRIAQTCNNISRRPVHVENACMQCHFYLPLVSTVSKLFSLVLFSPQDIHFSVRDVVKLATERPCFGDYKNLGP